MKNKVLSFLLLLLSLQIVSQTVYEHISNTNIYEFIDEMANEKYIELNSIIKPYSRKMIYNKLSEIKELQDSNEISLNKRQRNDLSFYLRAYIIENNSPNLLIDKHRFDLNKSNTLAVAANPLGLFYKDSVFALALQPILGASYSNNSNGGLTHTWGGASMMGYIGSNLGFYTNVRDNNVSQLLIKPEYFVHAQGVPVKDFGDDGVDYTEARGGMMYSWQWGNIGLIKDHVEWGTGYNGTNIQSGRTPSFAQIKLQLKPVSWFEFNYYHGWLVSEVVDSACSYWTNNTYRIVYFQKYMASNMFTFFPIKHLNISFGNSIVYTNESGGGPMAAYLIPFLFYKAVDITLSGYEKYGYASNNNQFFINVSSRNIKHLHLYFSLFADDISTSYFFDKDLYNSFSYKLGFRLSNFYIQNLTITGEYTLTNPYVYKHHAETQNYTSNNYNMGHYLVDNSQEFFLSLRYIPLRGLVFELAYSLAQHGDDYDINDPDAHVHSDPILENIVWQNQNIFFRARYEIVANTYVFGEFNYQNITGEQDKIEKYTPEYYWGNTSTFSVGMNVGF
ncbi:MAG: hypothetical protein QM503_11015 [Bacteroidota bacterium]